MRTQTVIPALALSLIALAILMAATAPADAQQYRQIRNVYSQKCLDVEGNSPHATANVQVYGCHNGGNQQWELVPLGGSAYRLRAQHSGFCLEVIGGSSHPNANVQQNFCGSGNRQIWDLLFNGSDFFLKNQRSGLCLDQRLHGPSDNVQQYPCHYQTNQRWVVPGLCPFGNCATCNYDGICNGSETEATCSDCHAACDNDGFCELDETENCADCMIESPFD
ncbi:MAG: ricin-type beta-trefoil lectin domain protein [Acidobacteriota bacterium]